MMFLAIHLTEDDVLRTDDSNDISQHVLFCHKIESAQVHETRRANSAPVRTVRAIRHQVHAKLALWRLHRRVRLAWRHVESLGVQLEVVDQALHRVLHLRARRRRHLAVVRLDHPLGHLVQALHDDSDALPHLLHADEVAVVAVSVRSHRNVKLHAVVHVVRLHLANVPRNPAAAQHGAGEAVRHGVARAHLANLHEPLLPDSIAVEHLLELVDARRKLLREQVDIFAESQRQVLRHASWSHVRGVHARTADSLVELHHLLALLERPEHGRERADVERVRRESEQVVEAPRDFGEQHANVLRAQGHLDAEQLFAREGVPLLLHHHRDVVESVEVRKCLHVRLVLAQFFRSSVQEPDVRVRAFDHLSVHFQDEAEHTVRRRVLRPKVEREVLDFAFRERVCRFFGVRAPTPKRGPKEWLVWKNIVGGRHCSRSSSKCPLWLWLW
mmetsp:Transcript_4758/g.11747  ORF Transcript_4758/g.11747 Transcript_4758/m.11747 type:complete len:443 (+) Transcript_4758:85-1413(+)